MKQLACAAAVALWLAATALATGSTRMTIEHSLAIRSLANPELSPDGRWVAYTQSEWDRENNRRISHIYLVPAAGGAPIKLTNGEKGESSPQWSPAGLRVAFLADRDKGNQIWWISATGGEAEKLTSEENAVTAFTWSPDGRRIAYVTRDVAKDKSEREKKKKDKFDAIVVDHDYQYSHLWILEVDTRAKRRLTEGEFRVSSPQWSPDGCWIAYALSRGGWQESSFTDISEERNTDIHVVSVDGGAPRRLTTNPGPDTSPRWSPDGGEIAYVASEDPKVWAAKSDILVAAADGSRSRNLTRDYPSPAGSGLTWSRDGRRLYFTGPIGSHSQLFQVPAAGGAVRQLTRGERSWGAFDVSRDGTRIAATLTGPLDPAEIWVAGGDGGQERRLTQANPQLGEFALSAPETIRWKGPGGLEVEGVLIRPLDNQPGKRCPLILQIHGGPYGRFDAGFNSRAQIFAANGYAVLMPNPRGSTGYGHAFTVANLGDWGGQDFQDIQAGVDALIARGLADPDKLAVMGGSYGGFMTFWTVTQTDRFKAAIGHAGISDWYSFHGQSDIPGLMEYGFVGQPWTAAETYRKYSPMTHVARVKTPLLITHGEQDRRVPIAQAEQYYRALKKRGVEVAFVRYPREGHGIQEPNHQVDLVRRQLEWLDSRLGISRAKPAPTGQ